MQTVCPHVCRQLPAHFYPFGLSGFHFTDSFGGALRASVRESKRMRHGHGWKHSRFDRRLSGMASPTHFPRGRVGGPRAGGQGGFGQAMQMMQMLQFAQQMQRRQMPFQGGRQPFGFAGTPTTPDRNSNLLSLNRTFTEAVSLPGTTQTSSAPAPEPPTMTRQERLREAIRQKRLEREARREEARQAPRRRSRQLIFMPTTVRGNASRR